jgi:hypothetical protein
VLVFAIRQLIAQLSDTLQVSLLELLLVVKRLLDKTTRNAGSWARDSAPTPERRRQARIEYVSHCLLRHTHLEKLEPLRKLRVIA